MKNSTRLGSRLAHKQTHRERHTYSTLHTHTMWPFSCTTSVTGSLPSCFYTNDSPDFTVVLMSNKQHIQFKKKKKKKNPLLRTPPYRKRQICNQNQIQFTFNFNDIHCCNKCYFWLKQEVWANRGTASELLLTSGVCFKVEKKKEPGDSLEKTTQGLAAVMFYMSLEKSRVSLHRGRIVTSSNLVLNKHLW